MFRPHQSGKPVGFYKPAGLPLIYLLTEVWRKAMRKSGDGADVSGSRERRHMSVRTGGHVGWDGTGFRNGFSDFQNHARLTAKKGEPEIPRVSVIRIRSYRESIMNSDTCFPHTATTIIFYEFSEFVGLMWSSHQAKIAATKLFPQNSRIKDRMLHVDSPIISVSAPAKKSICSLLRFPQVEELTGGAFCDIIYPNNAGC